MEHDVITMAHGAGGQLSHALMEEVVLPALGNTGQIQHDVQHQRTAHHSQNPQNTHQENFRNVFAEYLKPENIG